MRLEFGGNDACPPNSGNIGRVANTRDGSLDLLLGSSILLLAPLPFPLDRFLSGTFICIKTFQSPLSGSVFHWRILTRSANLARSDAFAHWDGDRARFSPSAQMTPGVKEKVASSLPGVHQYEQLAFSPWNGAAFRLNFKSRESEGNIIGLPLTETLTLAVSKVKN